MCDATVLPHWVHLFSWGACQRWEALRVRRRIFEVLRLGTPIRANRKAGNWLKTSELGSGFRVQKGKRQQRADLNPET